MSSPVTREGTDAADPRQFFRVLWRRKMILLLCITVLPATAYLYSTRLAKTYEASALISVQGTAVDTGLPVIGDFTSPGATNDAHVAALIETNAVADEAARQLGEPRGSLRGSVTATANEDTKFITITATAGSGERAAAIANTFASALRATRERRGVERVQASIAAVEKSLAKLPPEQRLQRAQLSESLQGLRTLQGAQAQNLQLMQSAAVSSDPVSPNPGRNAVLALVVALLIGAGAVVLVERLDRRLHDPLELEPLTGTPLLARVPESAFPGSAPDPQLPVAFQMLRDSLTYFNLDRPLTSLLVMSALKGDGKTSVITHLAAAYAQAGKRVVLVDADLRSPQVAGRMGVASAPGLSEVLTGGCVLEEALQEVGSFGGHLRVLAGGSIPPNPSEMLGSARMSTVLAQLSELCDLVLIDSAPLLVVSDAFPLLDQVVGIVGVAALERTDRDPIVRAIEVTEKAGGRVLGMVATGGRSHETYGYAYAHPYGGSGDREPAASPDPVVALANGNRQRSDTSGTGRVRRRFRAR